MRKSTYKELLANGEMSLAQIYEALPGKKKESVRGSLNLLVKSGALTRGSRGHYSLARAPAQIPEQSVEVSQ